MEPTLNFISTLIWQAILIAVFVIFRKDISALLLRIGTIKFGDKEISFQDISEEAEVESVPEDAELTRDENGFLTKDSIKCLVNSSRSMSGDEVLDAMLVFQTSSQQTWIVLTSSQLFIVLDDERTEKLRSEIQIKRPRSSLGKVGTRSKTVLTGSFKFDSTGFWLYSKSLLGEPDSAKEIITRFIEPYKTN